MHSVLLQRTRCCCLIAVFTSGIALAPAIAQAVPESSAEIPAHALPTITVGAGWANGVAPVGTSSAFSLSVDVARPTSGPVRWVAGLGYSREVNSSGSCCGPNPGFSYRVEALALSVGPELLLARHGASSLSVDARYQPTWYHNIRRGSQADFQPPPTEWNFSPLMGSVGTTARWPLASGLQGSLGARLQLNPSDVSQGGPVRRSFGLSLGVGW